MDQPDDVVVRGGRGREVGVPDNDVRGPQVLHGVLPDLVAVNGVESPNEPFHQVITELPC